MISLETGDRNQYLPKLTGGDGDSDIAGIKWESSDSKVVTENQNGLVTAVGAGNAQVTLTVTMYAGNPQVGKLNFKVTGDTLADTSALQAAIEAAKAAKDQEDAYYTEESLTAYQKALQKAEDDLAKAVAEKWDVSKQSLLDQDAADLNAAVEGLEKDNGIKQITIEGINGRLWLNKSIQLTAVKEPADAEEKVININ